MASYNSGFDAPPRPGQTDPRTRRLGTYMNPGVGRQEHGDADTAQRGGPAEQRRVYTQPSLGRVQQPNLPRPSMRSPSPGASVTNEASVGAGSRYGFAKPSSHTPVLARPIPELKGKSSRNVLRRKPSSIAHQTPRSLAERSGSTSPSKWSQVSAENRPSIEASLRSADAYTEIFTRTRSKTPVTHDNPAIIPELDRYRPRMEHTMNSGKAELPHKLSTTDLPPPTPLLSGTPIYSGSSSSHHRYSGYSGSGYSASPSTRFSESPGPGAAYSRDTTPTSMSSQSPGIVAPLKPLTPRLRQGSPAYTRPPVTRRRAGSTTKEPEGATVDPQGLPSLRESLTSSSSNSTVKGEQKANEKKEKKKKKRLSPLPPSPPPRKSSQKFKKPRSDTHESPSKASHVPAKSVMTSPSKSTPPTVAASKETTISKSVPPSRPSREGAPPLSTPAGESIAVIQSNLAGLSFTQDRRQSGLLKASPNLPHLVPRSTQGSRLPSRNPSPSPVLPSPRLGTPAPAGLGIVPDLKPASTKSSGLRTPSPSQATPKSRFGLFGRRTKTAPEVSTIDTSKPVRKGPSAGTGHEGYGRYGARPRSTSTSGLGRGRERSISAASSSQESIASTATHDPFLLERMSPVIIAGGEIVENRNASSELTRTESNTSLLLGRPSVESKTSSKSGLGREISRTTLWPSALPREPEKRGSILVGAKGRRPSDSSDDDIGKNSLAFRRSVQRLNNSSTVLGLPKPLKIPAATAGSSMTSLDASIMSDESQQEMTERGRGRMLQMSKSKKLEKRPKSPRKWNFFHRSQPKVEPTVEAPVSVTIGRPPMKPVPHYALLDSSDEMPENAEGMDLEDILRDADVIDLSNEELDVLQFGEMKQNLQRQKEQQMKTKKAQEERLPPILFSSPEPMQIATETPQKELHLTKEEAPVRPSRLPQVGRIPKVVSARPQATSPKSFSRPFARLSTIQPLPGLVVLDKQSIAQGASPPKPLTLGAPQGVGQAAMESKFRKGSVDSELESNTVANAHDFLAFLPRKNSAATATTTSSSSGGSSAVATTAIVPSADDELFEDEVWDEYDDLIENDEGIKVPASATSSHGVPFQYESFESRRMRKSKVHAMDKESPTLASAPRLQNLTLKVGKHDEGLRASGLTSSSVYSADMSPRLKDSLAALPTPTTPMSFTDFFSGYGDRNRSVSTILDNSAGKLNQRSSRSSSRKSTSSSSHSHHSRSLSGLVTIAEQDSVQDAPRSEREGEKALSQVNLRVGSMTVSKWLTFGHVLFSPAREAIKGSVKDAGAKRYSVLVIDGLGNDDWSFYAAETYPSATFYNLSPTAPLSPSSQPTTTAFPLTPPNHRQVQHPPLTANQKFPFPSSTFNVVVFRFPTALPVSTYSSIISEAKRVLLPGGYLELAVLDLDMLNMGPRTRKGVRGLKMSMQASNVEGRESLWTGSASDTVLKIIGKRGFMGVKSCVVGVPVATTPVSVRSAREGTKVSDRDDSITSPSQDSDEGITKMVARVGRWWYNRCYEGVLENSGLDGRSTSVTGSIFHDDELIAESEEWNSSFKLLVAHARKPVVARRRTLSA